MAPSKKSPTKCTIDTDPFLKHDKVAAKDASDACKTAKHVNENEEEDNEEEEADGKDDGENGEDGDKEDEEDVDDDEEEDPFLKFQNVMTAVDLERVKMHAVEMRRQQALARNIDQTSFACEVVKPPLHGSFNLVYELKFSDGIKWVARLPIQGTRMKEPDIDRMNTDYSTMKYIGQNFDIPIPEIYTWETTCDRVGVPFAFMSFVEGTSVCERWVDKEWITEEKKLTILTNLAHTMAKLQEPKFDKIGTLRFTEDGAFSHIGKGHTLLEDENTFFTEGTLDIQYNGPYNSRADFLAFEDAYEDVAETARIYKGAVQLMKIALQSVPAYLRQPNRCELNFFDFNYQNILIDDECNVTAIYDWDGVGTMPQGMGCTRYPSWITRDWDPARYDPPVDGDWDAIVEDSPEKLSRYRKHYADAFASMNLENYDPRQTRLAHILEAIGIGMCDRFSRQFVMIVLLNHAYGAEAKWPAEYTEILKTLMHPKTPAAKALRKKIAKQFQTMWHAEWEDVAPADKTQPSMGRRRGLLRRPIPRQDESEQLNMGKKTDGLWGYGRSISQFLSSKLAIIKR